MRDSTCNQCGEPVPSFQSIEGNVWLGHPVLYMGRDTSMGYAFRYSFCDAECMFEWLQEVLGY